jgi:hypothetical protein
MKCPGLVRTDIGDDFPIGDESASLKSESTLLIKWLGSVSTDDDDDDDDDDDNPDVGKDDSL